ncbi:unnamed protein product [Schistocephalus solidus]|uniref:DUF1659 domain-containing protein n=1 Tax=Schistocephalus solidus TaxID=70667 RepID=A0A183SSN6_SCHSO|nr:unnamed protein product [Schistocephalus solidus]
MAGYKNAPKYTYLVRASPTRTESGVVGPHPRITYSIESPEKDNSEDLRSSLDEPYAVVALASRLISLLEDSCKDA